MAVCRMGMEQAAGPPKRILIVDDEQDVREFVGSVLEDAGYRVALASNGQEGLEAIERDPPDLVVLDLMMPVMDGWSLLDRLKRLPDRPLVVILSAYGDDWKALRAGAWECLAKPFDHAQLLEACQRALAR